MFVVTVTFDVNPDHSDSFMRAMLQQATDSLEREIDCHVFEVCVGTDDLTCVYLYEKYSDAAAFDAHLQSAHFQSFDSLVKPWVVNKTVRTWHQVRGLT